MRGEKKHDKNEVAAEKAKCDKNKSNERDDISRCGMSVLSKSSELVNSMTRKCSISNADNNEDSNVNQELEAKDTQELDMNVDNLDECNSRAEHSKAVVQAVLEAEEVDSESNDMITTLVVEPTNVDSIMGTAGIAAENRIEKKIEMFEEGEEEGVEVVEDELGMDAFQKTFQKAEHT